MDKIGTTFDIVLIIQKIDRNIEMWKILKVQNN